MYLSKRESIATELRIALRRRRIKVVAESFFLFGFSLFRIQCHITSALMFVKGIPQMKKKVLDPILTNTFFYTGRATNILIY